MALINIDYGSLASSETMNKNFIYLDSKIADVADSINTNISSILSNIATLNSRLSDLSESIVDSVEDFTTEIESLKNKTQNLINHSTMVPNWANCIELSEINNYKVSSNGYIMINPIRIIETKLIVNNVSVEFKKNVNSYDFSSQLVAIPVKEGDIVTYSEDYNFAYFLPVSIFNYSDLS